MASNNAFCYNDGLFFDDGYTDEDYLLMETIDALLGDQQPAQPGPAPGISVPIQQLNSSMMGSQYEHPDTRMLRELEDYGDLGSPRVTAYTEPRYAPEKGHQTLKRNRDMPTHALEFSEKTNDQKMNKKAKSSCTKPKSIPDSPKHVKQEQRNLTSSYRGVCWYKRTNRWVVQIKVKGVRKHIGYFKHELEAAHAYEKAIEKLRVNPELAPARPTSNPKT
mmetsp:Transcript_11061/g.18107  ORF Transcript_11061/g.18107 Transcript_11061/m.18107 type:complete len:220 (-) Transcript_11061:1103-1762(-)